MISPLVSTDWLAEHLHDASLRIIDIRGHVLPASEPHPHYFSHRAEYLESHIEGALFVDWTSDIVEPDSISVDIANPERFADFMSSLGIDSSTTVVAYDDANGMFAARMWWALRYYGHDAVYVLNGGWQNWLAEGRHITAEIPSVERTNFVPMLMPELSKSADEILANLTEKRFQLVDVRKSHEFMGKSSRAKRLGHIPDALNIPRAELVAKDGTLLPADELSQIFKKAGLHLDTGNEIVIYCNGGVSASYGLLALNTLGFTNASVYDGSWKDWGNDDSKPIA